MNNRDKDAKASSRTIYNALLFSTCGLAGLLYGLDMGIVAAALPYIRESCDFSPSQLSGIVAAVILGSVPGSVLAGVVCDRIGRLAAFRLTALIFASAVPLVCLSGGNFFIMFAGRFLQGVGCGLVAIAAPLYLAETATAEHRGKGGGLIQLVLMAGLVLASFLGVVVARHIGPSDALSAAETAWAWQLMFWFTVIPAAIFLLFTFALKESPRWLYGRAEIQKALSSLLANHTVEDAKRILADMELKNSAMTEGSSLSETRDSLLKRKYIVPFLLVLSVVFFNQASGCNAVINYSVVLFNKAGLDGARANLADTLLKSCGFVATLIAVMLVDKLGRRTLLKIGTAGICSGLALVGCVFLALSQGWLIGGIWSGCLATVGFVVFMSSFCFGPGVCVWLVMGELMPMRIRAGGMTVANFVGMGVAWIIAQVFLPWCGSVGEFPVFATLSTISIGYLILVVFFLPETKGKTLEEIERFFMRKGK